MKDADYYQEHKDDDDEWGDPVPESPRKKSEKRQRAVMVSVRLSAGEAELVRALADDAGMPLSTWIRNRTLTDTHDFVVRTYPSNLTTSAVNVMDVLQPEPLPKTFTQAAVA